MPTLNPVLTINHREHKILLFILDKDPINILTSDGCDEKVMPCNFSGRPSSVSSYSVRSGLKKLLLGNSSQQWRTAGDFVDNDTIFGGFLIIILTHLTWPIVRIIITFHGQDIVDMTEGLTLTHWDRPNVSVCKTSKSDKAIFFDDDLVFVPLL